VTEHVEHRAHALLSASSAYRWLVCTASPRYEEGFPDQESEFAKEGTWAHGLAELKILSYLDSNPREAELAEARADRYWSKANEDYVDLYVTYAIERIEAAREINPDAVILVEQRLNYSHIAPEGFGTGDLVIVCDGRMEVIDLKFGKGKPVSAVDNKQAKLYAVGAVEDFGHLYEFDMVTVVIHQPRLDPEPSTWDIPVRGLLEWAETVKPIAHDAFYGPGKFVAGSHCDFCRGRSQCRENMTHNMATIKGEFESLDVLTAGEFAELLSVAKTRAAWYAMILEQGQKRALNGEKFPGFKLVEGRSNRRYKDQDMVAEALTANGIPAAAIYEPRTLLGITKMEQSIGKKVFKELLSDLVEKPSGKPTLVHDSDPRPEVEPGSSTDGFDDETETQ
jgi:hypothetical protein